MNQDIALQYCLFVWKTSRRKEIGFPTIWDFASCLGLILMVTPRQTEFQSGLKPGANFGSWELSCKNLTWSRELGMFVLFPGLTWKGRLLVL